MFPPSDYIIRIIRIKVNMFLIYFFWKDKLFRGGYYAESNL
nr:MAG TPA: hypothetical protein [Caudoviricetes sp.]